MKKAKNTEDAQKIQDKKDGIPHGWIQWKGTNLCMDIHCKCGEISHIDGDFVYHVICPYCKTIYFLNAHIEIIELEEEPEDFLWEASK